ncbi:PASTA domain-containing protein [Mycobacterium sp. B14F4]|uniref:PASTA domain-containing protein n=1 Tax=Mycobacterium sp. B14F4 TaxID=3153565 RepID=UPI00325D3443
MKRVIVVGLGSAFVAAATVVFGAGTAAAAPDVVGMTYSDAKKEIRDAGGKAVIASRVGDQLDENKCIVTNVWDSSFLRIASADNNEMSVALNCAGEYATATNPGLSVANPLGREAKQQDEEEAARKRAARQAAQQEEQELALAATPGA